jgi:hypothetical protein
MRVKVLVEDQKRFRNMSWKEGRRLCGPLEVFYVRRDMP